MLEKAKQVTTEKGKYARMEYARWADDLVVLVGWHSQQDWLWKGIDRRVREELNSYRWRSTKRRRGMCT